LVSVNLFEFILAAVLRSAALCIRLRNILRKWFVTSGVQRGGTNGASAPGIQGRGHPKSEVAKI